MLNSPNNGLMLAFMVNATMLHGKRRPNHQELYGGINTCNFKFFQFTYIMEKSLSRLLLPRVSGGTILWSMCRKKYRNLDKTNPKFTPKICNNTYF